MVDEYELAASETPPDRPVTSLEWAIIDDLLQAGQYEQAAVLLYEGRLASERAGNHLLANMLAATHLICLACARYQTEAEWHLHSHIEINRQEQVLRHWLLNILGLLNEDGDTDVYQAWHELTRTTPAHLSSAKQPSGKPFTPQRLRQFIGNLLQNGPGFLASHPPDLAKPDQLPAVPGDNLDLPLRISEASQQNPKILVEQQPVNSTLSPVLVVYCFGAFQVIQDGQPVADWPSRKGKAIFKYLVTHREWPVPKEVLMDLFWPEASPDAARNNLNVAIYGLREALRKTRPAFSHVVFQDGLYLLNPELRIWVDLEEFTEHFLLGRTLERRGEVESAIQEYAVAEALYRGEFLGEDRYEDWLLPQRQQLQDSYIDILDKLSSYYLEAGDYTACAAMCGKMLAVESCLEAVHRRLMRCYCRQQQRNLALRQYLICVETLQQELEVAPTEITATLVHRIRAGEDV